MIAKFKRAPEKVNLVSPWIALAPVTVTISLLVEPVRTAFPEAVPVTFPVNGPVKPSATKVPVIVAPVADVVTRAELS